MTGLPRLTVGLPVYNGEEYLAESLDALLGQTFEDFELIISDNASTDGTAGICRHYARQDSRIRYLRQPRNIGAAPNHNVLVRQARGELFKWAASDDLYARDLMARCVAALDEYPQVVLAHSLSAIIDGTGTATKLVRYPVRTSAPRAPDRFASMLFDGWGEDEGGVIRTEVLLRTALHGSYHFADRTFVTELGLHGPFYHVPDPLYFRRDHPGCAYRSCTTMRARCANLDPRRADRLRNPAVRLYGEYAWGYVAAIRRAPLSSADRRECYRHLARWLAGRAGPAAGRLLHGGLMQAGDPATAAHPVIQVDSFVAGRESRQP
jgi:glycosyltransferase involved in cell wall biosynthesis